MWGNTGSALVLLLIVRNFQRGSCHGLTVKFIKQSIFLFCEYEKLFNGVSGHLMLWFLSSDLHPRCPCVASVAARNLTFGRISNESLPIHQTESSSEDLRSEEGPRFRHPSWVHGEIKIQTQPVAFI